MNPSRVPSPVSEEKGHANVSRYFSWSRAEMLPFLPPTAHTFLDVGCASGAFGEKIRSQGKEVWGIEMDPAAAAQAERKLNRVLIGDALLKSRELPEQTFDCIVCNDVLEHLVDPFAVLQELRSKLTQEGRLVASLPNVRYARVLAALLLQGEWKYRDSGILDRTHLRFFTRKSMLRFFDEAGYKVEVCRGISRMRAIFAVPIVVLSLGFFRDTVFRQFAIVARRKD